MVEAAAQLSKGYGSPIRGERKVREAGRGAQKGAGDPDLQNGMQKDVLAQNLGECEAMLNDFRNEQAQLFNRPPFERSRSCEQLKQNICAYGNRRRVSTKMILGVAWRISTRPRDSEFNGPAHSSCLLIAN